jgi:hypothetical protein
MGKITLNLVDELGCLLVLAKLFEVKSCGVVFRVIA